MQNDQIPAAIMSRVSSLAPTTNLRCQAIKATKNETNAVAKKKIE
jgi:hypothetical protein